MPPAPLAPNNQKFFESNSSSDLKSLISAASSLIKSFSRLYPSSIFTSFANSTWNRSHLPRSRSSPTLQIIVHHRFPTRPLHHLHNFPTAKTYAIGPATPTFNTMQIQAQRRSVDFRENSLHEHDSTSYMRVKIKWKINDDKWQNIASQEKRNTHMTSMTL